MGSTISKDILISDDLIKKHQYFYKNDDIFKSIYSFSNENLIDCFNSFDFRGKGILSVLASSDQVLDMYLRGASIVDTFDINPLTKHYFYLKKAALESGIPKDLYLSFLNPHHLYENPYCMNDRIYSKIKNLINGKSRMYWDYLYEVYDEYTIASEILSSDSKKNNELINNVLYLNSNDNFSKMVDLSKNIDITFITSNVKKLRSKLNKKYDYIYLSNIMQYVNKVYPSENKETSLRRYKTMLEILSRFLKENGKIINYVFYLGLEERRKELELFFCDDNYECKTTDNDGNGILIYTKKTTLK